MKRLLNSSFALVALLLASSCSTKDNDSLLAPSPAPNQDVTTKSTTGKNGAARSVTGFVALPGSWQDVGIGGGTYAGEQIYALGSNESGSGNVWLFNNNLTNPGWTLVPGVIGRRITVDGDGTPWIVAPSGDIYKLVYGSWAKLPGQANDIGAAANNVYIVGYGSGNRDVYAYQPNSNSWYTARVGQGVRIDADNSGFVWLLNERGEVYKGNIGGFTKQPGQLKDIGATCYTNPSSGTAIYGIGYGSANKSIYENVGGGWYAAPNGEAVIVDVDQNGRPWVITANGTLHYSY